MSLLQKLANLRLLVVTGKGGVGKSAISAALGSAIARAGKRVLVLEVDPRESLYRLLGQEPSGGEIVRARPGLYVQNLRPRAVLDLMVREHLHIGPLADRVLASPVYQHFAEGAPGLKEMAVIEHVHRLVRGGSPRPDLVVLDAPATGHGLATLTAPTVVSQVIHDGPVGRLARRLSGFVADPGRCGIVLITQAEEMPVQEAIETIEAMEEKLSRKPELVVVNSLYPSAMEEELWRERRRVNEQQLERLYAVWKGPSLELPMLPLDGGPALIEEMETKF
jgi:anion-transporting  ArsA/GET3 family ATPase